MALTCRLSLKGEYTTLFRSRCRHGYRLTHSLLRVTAAFRVLNQSFDLVGRRGNLESDGEGDVFECRPGSFQAEFVRDIKGATDIDLSFLDRNFVEMREPRNLGKQSKRSAHKEIRKRRWREISSATLLRLIALEAKASDSSF